MLDLLFEGAGFFMNPFYYMGVALWNLMLALTGFTSTQTPSDFSMETWGFVIHDLYPWALGIGVLILNISYCIGILRHAGDLKQNFTLEALIECFIRVIIANAFLVSGVEIMRLVFRMASGMAGEIFMEMPVMSVQQDTDVGSALFYMFFGVIFFIACLVCSGMMFLVVYGRYLQLYLLVCTMPFAIATLPGGAGMAQTGYAWVRTFIAKAFEIVVIVLAIVIASKMMGNVDFGSLDTGFLGIFDGAVQALKNLSTMLLLTAAVKGADMMMRRFFAL